MKCILIFFVMVWLYLQVQFHLMLYIQMQLCERSLKDWIFERNTKPKEEHTSRCNCYTCITLQYHICPLQMREVQNYSTQIVSFTSVLSKINI